MGLTRHKISDRARERGWLKAKCTNYDQKLNTSERGAVRCIAWLGGPALRIRCCDWGEALRPPHDSPKFVET